MAPAEGIAAAAPVGAGRSGLSAGELAEEERLVRAAASGDRVAFQRIYEAHAGLLYGYAVARLGDPERAEDVVQDSFVAFIKAAPRYQARAPLRAFLLRVTRNRVLNAWRDQRPEDPLVERQAPAGDPEGAIDLRRALARLPERFREPLLLAAYEGLTYEEVAEVLDCPIGTVRSRIARGKRRLADLLGPGREG